MSTYNIFIICHISSYSLQAKCHPDFTYSSRNAKAEKGSDNLSGQISVVKPWTKSQGIS